jgi:hypothetical protein
VTTQRKTSDKAVTAASKVMHDGRTSKASKTAAASALSQAAPKKPLPNAPSKKEGAKSGGKRGNNTDKKK